MGQPKGKTGNPNGRKRGVPNKVNADLRQWINDFLEDNKEKIQKDFDSMLPKDRTALFERLLKYRVPTLQATTLTTEFDHLTDTQLDEIVERLKQSIK